MPRRTKIPNNNDQQIRDHIQKLLENGERISVTHIREVLKVGYTKAKRLVDELVDGTVHEPVMTVATDEAVIEYIQKLKENNQEVKPDTLRRDLCIGYKRAKRLIDTMMPSQDNNEDDEPKSKSPSNKKPKSRKKCMEDELSGDEEEVPKRKRPKKKKTEQEVEKIAEYVLDKRYNQDQAEYLVKWTGLPHSENSWSVADPDCEEAIAEYERQQQEKQEEEESEGLKEVDMEEQEPESNQEQSEQEQDEDTKTEEKNETGDKSEMENHSVHRNDESAHIMLMLRQSGLHSHHSHHHHHSHHSHDHSSHHSHDKHHHVHHNKEGGGHHAHHHHSHHGHHAHHAHHSHHHDKDNGLIEPSGEHVHHHHPSAEELNNGNGHQHADHNSDPHNHNNHHTHNHNHHHHHHHHHNSNTVNNVTTTNVQSPFGAEDVIQNSEERLDILKGFPSEENFGIPIWENRD